MALPRALIRFSRIISTAASANQSFAASISLRALSQSSYGSKAEDSARNIGIACAAAASLAAATFAALPAYAKAPAAAPPSAPSTATAGKELPTYTPEEVAKHRTRASRIWVTYKGEVYDITDFIEVGPGRHACD